MALAEISYAVQRGRDVLLEYEDINTFRRESSEEISLKVIAASDHGEPRGCCVRLWRRVVVCFHMCSLKKNLAVRIF